MWTPTPRSHATFASVFPHVVAFGAGRILLGSRQPIQLDVPRWLARVRLPGIAAHLRIAVARDIATGLQTAQPWVATGDLALNTDLFPRDEFETPLGPS